VFQAVRGAAEVRVAAGAVTPLQGFVPPPAPATVLAEELFYSARFRPYRVLLLDRVPGAGGADGEAGEAEEVEEAAEPAEAAACGARLQALAGADTAAAVEADIAAFHRSCGGRVVEKTRERGGGGGRREEGH
jgi:hypothetical protein